MIWSILFILYHVCHLPLIFRFSFQKCCLRNCSSIILADCLHCLLLPLAIITILFNTKQWRFIIVRVLLCVSSVPASCVHIWFVSCPCFMSLWVKYVPAVFVWLCVNYPVYISPVFWVWFRLVYSLLPRCILSMSVLPCPALMSPLNIIIWVYVLVCVSLFLPRVCTVTIIALHKLTWIWN